MLLVHSLIVFSQEKLIEKSPIFPNDENTLWCFIESRLDFRLLNTAAVRRGEIRFSLTVDKKGNVTDIETIHSQSDLTLSDSLKMNEIKRVLNLLPPFSETQRSKTKYELSVEIPYPKPQCRDFDNVTFGYWQINVDEPPLFQSNDETQSLINIYRYIISNLFYPYPSPISGHGFCTGRVIVQTIIDEKGKTTDCKIIRESFNYSYCSELGEMAIKLVEKMPEWTPAKINGKPVRCYYLIPIVFRLD